MSRADESTPDVAAIEALASPIHFPQEFDTSGSWDRKTEHDRGGWINDAERMVWLEHSDEPHRVVFVLVGRTLRVDCDCAAHHYDDWCAHIASCWWDWINGSLVVSHLRTGRAYEYPPDWLRVQLDGQPERYDGLTSAELDAYLACELGEWGVTEYADETDRAKGTIGNLLSRARNKVGAPTPHAGGGSA